MKNLTINKEFFKTKVSPIVLSIMMASSILGFTGCSNKDDEEQVVYKVHKTESEKIRDGEENDLKNHKTKLSFSRIDSKRNAKYDHYIDLKELEKSSSLDGFIVINSKNENNSLKDYIYPVRHINYTTSPLEALKLDNGIVTPGYFKENSTIIFPESLNWAEEMCNSSKSYLDRLVTGKLVGEISFIEYRSIVGNKYLYQQTKLKIKSDIEEPESKFKSQEELNDNDYILNRVLFKVEDNKLIPLAAKQTGVGKNCANVTSLQGVDLNEIFKPVSSVEKESKKFKNTKKLKKYLYLKR